jgi:hypothetical protein
MEVGSESMPGPLGVVVPAVVAAKSGPWQAAAMNLRREIKGGRLGWADLNAQLSGLMAAE